MTESQTNTIKFAYHEPAKALKNRIQSHAKYSNFNLHDWIEKNFEISQGQRILDLGCGNGNYTELFWKKVAPNGFITGLDKNPDLINDAKKNHHALPESNINFATADFDHPLPISSTDRFNWVFAIYSLYYTENSRKIIGDIKEKMAPGGKFVVIGPGAQNGKELEAFNLKLTGKKASPKYLGTLERIESDFTPIFNEFFGSHKVTKLTMDSEMTFPTAMDFSEYYWSTLLWRESVEGRTPDEISILKQKTLEQITALPVVVRKQLQCIVGQV